MTWKTAQTTGAMGFMPYGDAEIYSGIYNTQSALEDQQKEILNDVMRAASLVNTKKDNEQPTASKYVNHRADWISTTSIIIVEFVYRWIGTTYKKFESEHSGA